MSDLRSRMRRSRKISVLATWGLLGISLVFFPALIHGIVVAVRLSRTDAVLLGLVGALSLLGADVLAIYLVRRQTRLLKAAEEALEGLTEAL